MESAESQVLPFVHWPIQHRIARRGCPAWREGHVRALFIGAIGRCTLEAIDAIGTA